MLEIDVRHRIGDFSLDARFKSARGGITALFGRSGAGKTLLVNLIAGLARPDEGRIVLDDTVMFDSEKGIDLPPERRRIGYVFQEGRLFPHLRVSGNLTYGMKRTPPSERRISFDHVVALLGLGSFLDRRPAALSGGEKQRVAIGRALLSSPRLLLMDEPLASLDAPRKNEILHFIESLRDEFHLPTVYVSHTMEEIVRLSDTMVLVDEGRTIAQGKVDELMSRLDLRPLTGRFEAGSVINTRVDGHDPAFAISRLTFAGGAFLVPRIDVPEGTEIRVRVRARDVTLSKARPQSISALNVFSGTIREISEDGGASVEVLVDIGVPLWARISAKSRHDLELCVGAPVFAILKAMAFDGHSLGRPRTRSPDARS